MPRLGRKSRNSLIAVGFIASVGAASKTVMGFEFLIPKDYKPVGLFVKNIRSDVSSMKATPFPTIAERDAGILSGSIVQMEVDAPDVATFWGSAEPLPERALRR